MSDRYSWYSVSMCCIRNDTAIDHTLLAYAKNIRKAVEFAEYAVFALEDWDDVSTYNACGHSPEAVEVLKCILPFLEEHNPEREIVAGYLLSTVGEK